MKKVFGAKIAASLTMWMPAFSIVVCETAVTLTGIFCLSSGSFCAVTVTVGIWKRSGSSWEALVDWVCGAAGVCARRSRRRERQRQTSGGADRRQRREGHVVGERCRILRTRRPM